jgi:hypothetical protein
MEVPESNPNYQRLQYTMEMLSRVRDKLPKEVLRQVVGLEVLTDRTRNRDFREIQNQLSAFAQNGTWVSWYDCSNEDPRVKELVSSIRNCEDMINRKLQSGEDLTLIGILRHLMFKLKCVEKQARTSQMLVEFMTKAIEDYREVPPDQSFDNPDDEQGMTQAFTAAYSLVAADTIFADIRCSDHAKEVDSDGFDSDSSLERGMVAYSDIVEAQQDVERCNKAEGQNAVRGQSPDWPSEDDEVDEEVCGAPKIANKKSKAAKPRRGEKRKEQSTTDAYEAVEKEHVGGKVRKKQRKIKRPKLQDSGLDIPLDGLDLK